MHFMKLGTKMQKEKCSKRKNDGKNKESSRK
jgi:hypothetical protein